MGMRAVRATFFESASTSAGSALASNGAIGRRAAQTDRHSSPPDSRYFAVVNSGKSFVMLTPNSGL